MNTLRLGLRTLALLALVLASTAVLVKPELIGGPGHYKHHRALAAGGMPVVGHH
ncbi:MAG: hypothetical protein ACRYGO_09305 [Janthinobacterium lividum]